MIFLPPIVDPFRLCLLYGSTELFAEFISRFVGKPLLTLFIFKMAKCLSHNPDWRMLVRHGKSSSLRY